VNKVRDLPHESKLFQPGDRFGVYVIECLVDEDKSGRVYKAVEENLGRILTLKVLSTDLARNTSFLDVLRIQMQTALSVQNSGIADLYGIGELNGIQYVASEWSPNGWLSQQIIQSEKLSLPEALDIIIKCAETLQAAAKTKIWHGNLRLNSILMYPGGEIKISEIGFVASVRALFGESNLPVYLGAARFLAPEMTLKGAVDHRADIYSLGLIFYFLLFSATPFRYEGEALTGPSQNIEIDSMDGVLKVISKMTETQPGRRYQDYESLLEDLRSFLSRSNTAGNLPIVKRSIGDPIKNQKLFKLLCVLYASGLNGTLTAIEGPIRRVFYIRTRDVVYFESNQPEEDIWNWLVEKKEIDPKNKPSPNEKLSRGINRVIDRGLIRLEDFRHRYQELAGRTVSEALKTPNSNAEFLTAEIDGESLCSIRLSGLLLKCARYTVDLKDVLSEIKSDSYLNRTGLFESLTSSFSLTPEEGLLLAVSQDGIYTGSLQASSGSSNEKGLRFLYLLTQIGALEMRATQDLPAPQPKDTTTVVEHFELDEPLPDSNVRDSVRVEVQRSTSKKDAERLDLEAEKRFEQAMECYRNSKYWEASHLCEQALGLHEDGRYYWLMGMSYSQHPRFRHKAEDCFHRAIKLDPLNDELHVELADFYVTNGLLLRARTHCKKALEVVPDQARAREMLNSSLFASLGSGGCCCEHDPGCNHEEHKAWRTK